MPIYVTTSDGFTFVIDKGGEQLTPNTYGFEIEFCSHDSSVFAFTHVDVAVIRFKLGPSEGSQEDLLQDWRIETDSGNVLELVTSPLLFNTTQEAYGAKKILSDFLKDSVSPPQVSDKVMAAVILALWAGQVPGGLGRIAAECYHRPFKDCAIAFKDWAEVGSQLTVENVDDGVNIKAALKRHEINKSTWDLYVGQTVLCKSEKDWGQGYSSQVNMPMTLPGFFLYVVKKKLPKSNARIEHIIPVTGVEGISDATLQQRVTTWFWGSIIAAASSGYSTFFFDLPAERAVDISVLDYSQVTLAQLRQLSFIYVAANKILTGALGALSELNQLGLQNIAWTHWSTAAMVADSPVSYQTLVTSAGIETTGWLEYHSSMKDLTGLWFKAALMDVADKEDLGIPTYRKVAQVLAGDAERGAAIWQVILERYITLMKSKGWDKLWRERPGYSDELEDLPWRDLLKKIVEVELALAKALLEFAGWLEAQPNPRQAGFQLAPRDQRKFLHYSDARAWEGRYDTMYPAIQRADGAWTYLIEHRFN